MLIATKEDQCPLLLAAPQWASAMRPHAGTPKGWLWLAITLIFLLSNGKQGLQAQASMLEQIGISEVEVYYHINPGREGFTIRKSGEILTVAGEGIKAEYRIVRGKVLEIRLDQHFSSENAAEQAWQDALQICRDQGVGMKAVTGTAGRILRGEGNGLRSSLVLVTLTKGYRLEAQVVALR
jgi:hypothetical protein